MKIYVSHSRAFDYSKELYEPLRNSLLNDCHEITLPNENSETAFSTKDLISAQDLLIAEVSYPSTGGGIELGWASAMGIKILCISQREKEISSSLKTISKDFIEYSGGEELVKSISEFIGQQ